MFHVLAAYLAAAGGAAAGAQVARGVVRGVMKLAGGDARGAAAEVLGGLAAPAVAAAHQASLLAADVCCAAAALTGCGSDTEAPAAPHVPPGRRRVAAAESNAVAA
jgi:hypothetical protein